MANKIAVVTGANRGLGYAVAAQLARRNVRVILTARDPAAGAQAARELAKQQLDVVFHPLDVTHDADAQQLAAFIAANYGRLDLLINNAGVVPQGDTSVLNVAPAILREAFETNCTGPISIVHHLLPMLKAASTARVLNVSTALALLEQMSEWAGMMAAYRLSKAALNAATVAMALELHDDGISVNALHPGWLRTATGGPDAPLEADDGAASVVWAALDAPAELSGVMIHEGKVLPW
jgi:NAD(P)-dependent dehydrogenase (short-subunit alcohol dehydrogenase family)